MKRVKYIVLILTFILLAGYFNKSFACPESDYHFQCNLASPGGTSCSELGADWVYASDETPCSYNANTYPCCWNPKDMCPTGSGDTVYECIANCEFTGVPHNNYRCLQDGTTCCETGLSDCECQTEYGGECYGEHPTNPTWGIYKQVGTSTTCENCTVSTGTCYVLEDKEGGGTVEPGNPWGWVGDFWILDFEQVISAVNAVLLPLGIIITVIFIIIAGYGIMSSQGNPQQLQDSQQQLTSALIGGLFILLSVTIIKVIINELLGG